MSHVLLRRLALASQWPRARGAVAAPLASAAGSSRAGLLDPARRGASPPSPPASVRTARTLSSTPTPTTAAGAAAADRKQSREQRDARTSAGARALHDAKEAGTLLALTPEDREAWEPRSVAEAKAVAFALAREHAGDVVGWKCGATNAAVQTFLGVTGPFAGPVFRKDQRSMAVGDGVDEAKAVVDDSFGPFVRGLEFEYCVRLGADLPYEGAPRVFTVDEVRDVVSHVFPTVEVVGSRLAGDADRSNTLMLIADQGSHSGLLEATPLELEAAEGFDAMETTGALRVFVNGELQAEGDYTNVMGHPIVSVTWLANELQQQQLGLRKGDVVSAGTCTGLTLVAHGDHVRAEFDGFGSVVVDVTRT